MKGDLQKVARVVFGGHPYIVFRDAGVEGQLRTGGFGKVLRRFIISEANGKDYVGCIVFYLELLTAYSWKSDEDTMYGFSEMLEYSLANLLPHLPLDVVHMKTIFKQSSTCLIYNFDKRPDELSSDKITYSIETKESFFSTAQRIVFGDHISKRQIRREVLQILLNELEESPSTYMKVENLQSSIPVTTKDLLFQLHILKEEDKVDFVTEPSNSQKIISIKIKAKGIRELETEVDVVLKYPQMVKNVYGTNIENTTYGTNSPITVSIDEIETVFEALQKEIKESSSLKNKEVVSKSLTELENQIKKEKNPEKVKSILEELKSSSKWIYDKVVSNPITAGIIVELLMRVGGK